MQRVLCGLLGAFICGLGFIECDWMMLRHFKRVCVCVWSISRILVPPQSSPAYTPHCLPYAYLFSLYGTIAELLNQPVL